MDDADAGNSAFPRVSAHRTAETDVNRCRQIRRGRNYRIKRSFLYRAVSTGASCEWLARFSRKPCGADLAAFLYEYTPARSIDGPNSESRIFEGIYQGGIEEMAVIREWRSVLANAVQRGYPITDDWMGGLTAVRPPTA